MAGEQPVEDKGSPPGAFPETPAADDNQTFSVNPIPASEGTGNPVSVPPGEGVPDPSTINDNTVTSTAHDDPELKSKDQGEQTFGVAPIPATGGIGNPVQLQPGEKVPDSSTLTGNTVDSTAKTDEASYEKSDAGAPVNPPAQSQPRESEGGSGAMIPESGIPMGKDTPDLSKEDMGPNVSSVGPNSTTNQLAGEQPIEPRGTPQVVSEGQEDSKAPEESTNDDKGGISGKAAAGMGAAGVAAAGGAVAANEMIKDKTNRDPAGAMPQSVQDTVNEKSKESSVPEKAAEKTTTTTTNNSSASKEPSKTEVPAKSEEPSKSDEGGISTGAAAGVGAAGVGAAGAGVAANEMMKDETGKEGGEDPAREITTTVPNEVTSSQKEAGQEAEAAANPEAVKEKSEVENELLSKVKSSDEQGEPAPTESAAAATSAPETTTSSTGAPQLGDPTAGVAALSMDDKPADGLNATKDSAAEPAGDTAGRVNKLAEQAKPMDSRDVSPMSKRPATGQAGPEVTTGAASSTTTAESSAKKTTSTPQKKRQSFVDVFKNDTPSSAKTSSTGATTDSKKDKRRSFFGKIKDKLKS